MMKILSIQLLTSSQEVKNQYFLEREELSVFITQITATGAGAMTLPILVKKCHCPPKHVCRNISCLWRSNFSSRLPILHYNMGNVPIFLVLFLLIGSIPGVVFGVKIASKISPRRLIAIFSGVILVAAIFFDKSWDFGII